MAGARDDLLMSVRQDMSHLEGAFTLISTALEDLPQPAWPLFLAKLSLLLADRLEDTGALAEAIETARQHLDRHA